MLNVNFNNDIITAFGIIFQSYWKMIDLELEYHEKLLNNISKILDQEINSLSNEYERIRKANIDELSKGDLLDKLNGQENDFDNYGAVYTNSIYINIYTIFENSLLGICENYHAQYIFSITKRKDNESLIQYYFRAIEKVADIKNMELQEEINLINNSYRKLRNILVHNRYLCSDSDFEDIKDLKGVTFSTTWLYQDKYRVVIQDKEFLIEFIIKIRRLIKDIYIFYHNSIIESKFRPLLASTL